MLRIRPIPLVSWNINKMPLLPLNRLFCDKPPSGEITTSRPSNIDPYSDEYKPDVFYKDGVKYVRWDGKAYKVRYKGIIEEEWTPEKFREFQKIGVMNRHFPVPQRRTLLEMMFGSKKNQLERLKMEQMYLQLQADKPMYLRGLYADVSYLCVLGLSVIMSITILFQMFMHVCPPKDNPFLWKDEGKTNAMIPHGSSSHDDH